MGMLSRHQPSPLMKHYTVTAILPTSSQLHTFVNGRLSEAGKVSPAFYALCHLFASAQVLYSTLNFFTSENLTPFVKAKRYLSQQQEHDLMALTALYATALNTVWITRLVEQDTSLSEGDRLIINAALDLYKTTTAATSAALGHPVWLEPER